MDDKTVSGHGEANAQRASALHRLADLLTRMNFFEAQLQVQPETGGPHRTRALGTRIAALHHRSDTLEDGLRRCARDLCIDDH